MAEQIIPFDTNPQKHLRIVECAGCEAYEQQMRAMAEQREADELELRRMRRRLKNIDDKKAKDLLTHEDSAVAKAIFDYWVQVAGKNVRTTFGPKRKMAVLAALALLRPKYNDDEHHAERAICCAILGCVNNGFTNDKGELQDDLELICRDDKKIDQNLDRYRAWKRSKGEEPLV